MFYNKKTRKKISLKENFKLYLRIAGTYKWTFWGILALALVIEMARISDKFLFKIIIDKSEEFFIGTLASNLFVQILLGVGAAYMVIMFTKVTLNFINTNLINNMETRMMRDLKMKFFNHILHLDHNFHTTHKTGSMIARMNRGVRAVEVISDFLIVNLTQVSLQVIIGGLSLLYFDALSAVVLVITAFTFIIWSGFIIVKQQYPQYLLNRAVDIEHGNMADIFTNIDSIKYFGKERLIKQKYAKLTAESSSKQINFWKYNILMGTGRSLITGLGTFFIIFFPLLGVLNGTTSVGTLAFIYTIYLGLVGPLFGFVSGAKSFFVSLGDIDSLYEYDKITNAIVDKPGARKLDVRDGKIEFKNVEFSYYDRKVLDGVNLEIKPGEKVAFVGHSGSGKTTLVKLLYRLYNLNKGDILIDGKNIDQFRQETLRSEMSVVTQEAILFDDTIYNNIKFSNPRASREDVFRAMKFAQLDAFVARLPKKENTIVGERGVKLSGGEKQRVSIARALLANKKILVLDEATSALDSKTEHEIQKDLERLMKGRTSIIIAHRLSTIMSADKIVVMDRGRIAQIGKHNELIKKRGVYKELWNLQKGGYIEE